MAANDYERLERFLMDSFGDGIYFRELRLSPEEAEYVQKRYPKAKLKKAQFGREPDEKNWYEIYLGEQASFQDGLKAGLEAVKQENVRLKRELEKARQSSFQSKE
ncbi:hypothetical protein [Sediminibacillus massiliensis]|uniref:hypothetical protein n=1 Tax=Sediminibacillus massiliensis TaxID=1926277 RepID=UPI0009887E34|nr:hypothetical protein [Sediminibacillus massiliensis]